MARKSKLDKITDNIVKDLKETFGSLLLFQTTSMPFIVLFVIVGIASYASAFSGYWQAGVGFALFIGYIGRVKVSIE